MGTMKRISASLKGAAEALDRAKGEVLYLEASLAEALATSLHLEKLMADFEAQRDANPAWRMNSPCLRFAKVDKDDDVQDPLWCFYEQAVEGVL